MKQNKTILLTCTVILVISLILAETFFNISSIFTKSTPRLASFDTLVNFRDLGNYATADGKKIIPYRLLRSGALIDLSEHDIKLLTDTYKVKHIIDLREPIEMDEKPNVSIPNTTYHHINLYSDGIPGSSSFTEYQRSVSGKVDVIDEMHNSYNRLTLSSYSHEGMRQLFRILLTNEAGSVLWHCSSGKDRTGLPTAILLHILGASQETINYDYMLSNEARKKANEEKEAQMRADGEPEWLIEETLQTLVVRQEYLTYAYKLMAEHFGGLDAYIENVLQLTQDDQQRLRDLYLV